MEPTEMFLELSLSGHVTEDLMAEGLKHIPYPWLTVWPGKWSGVEVSALHKEGCGAPPVGGALARGYCSRQCRVSTWHRCSCFSPKTISGPFRRAGQVGALFRASHLLWVSLSKEHVGIACAAGGNMGGGGPKLKLKSPKLECFRAAASVTVVTASLIGFSKPHP